MYLSLPLKKITGFWWPEKIMASPFKPYENYVFHLNLSKKKKDFVDWEAVAYCTSSGIIDSLHGLPFAGRDSRTRSWKWIHSFNLPVPLTCNALRLMGAQLNLCLTAYAPQCAHILAQDQGSPCKCRNCAKSEKDHILGINAGADPGYVKRGGWDPKGGGRLADITRK